MPKLRLFGHDLDVSASANLDGLNVAPTLSADQKSLRLVVSGSVARAQLAFDTQFTCEVAGDRVLLRGVTSGAVVSAMRLKKPLDQAEWVLTGADLPHVEILADGDPEGLRFTLPFSVMQDLAQQVMQEGSQLVNVKWSTADQWHAMSVTFLAGDVWFLAVKDDDPSHHEVEVSDKFADAKRIQNLTIDRMLATDGEIRLLLLPNDGALLLHGDPLDARDQMPKEDNDILFQHALVNGHLEWRLIKNGNSLDHGYRWAARRELQPGMVVFRLHDEHGHPVVLLADEFPLANRNGLVKPAHDGEHRSYEQTTQTMVVRKKDDAPMQGVKLAALHPLKIRLAERGADELFFVDKDTKSVSFADKPPLELHGLAKGSYLERTSEDARAADCTVKAEQIPAPGGDDGYYGSLFTKTHVELLGPAHWQLKSQLEEREVHPGTEMIGTGAVGERLAKPAAGATSIPLPLIDSHWACSNLVGDKQIDFQLPAQIAGHARDWLTQIDGGLRSTFAGTRVDLPQTHAAGHAILPQSGNGETRSFAMIVEPPPGVIKEPGLTARRGAHLLAGSPVQAAAAAATTTTTLYLHGGDRQPSDLDAVKAQYAVGWPDELTKKIDALRAFWNGGKGEARRALREFLGGKRQVAQNLDDHAIAEAALKPLYERALVAVQSKVPVEGLDRPFSDLKDAITNLQGDLKKWNQYWNTPIDENVNALQGWLLDWLWQPATDDLFRGVLEGLWQGGVPTPPDKLPKYLRAYADQLRQMVPYQADWQKLLARVPSGVLSNVQAGVDQAFAYLVDLWPKIDKWLDLRIRYGMALTQDVYQALLQKADDAERVLNDLRGMQLPEPINTVVQTAEKLADLSNEPPEYLFFTKLFTVAKSNKDDHGLWQQLFKICNIGQPAEAKENQFWTGFLGQQSSVIVKLTGKRSLNDILLELERSYTTDTRPQPFGLDVKTGLVDFMHPDLADPNWRGVIFIRPTIDIGDDKTLSDLAGLTYLEARYIAVGGARLSTLDAASSLDTYARIYLEQPQPPPEKTGDVSLSLIKFDVTIKHNQLEAGEIVFFLDLQNVWGRKQGDVEGGKPPYKLPNTYIRGTLPPREPEKQGGDSPPRSFEFAAWFSPALEIDIDLAFLKELKFKAIRVGRNKGNTTIDIDCDLTLQKLSGIPIDIGLFDEANPPTIGLENFRIVLPSAAGAGALRIGVPRGLDFDFPSVSFNLPKPRIIHLGGIELKPVKIGFCRLGSGFTSLRDAYTWLGDIPEPPANVDIDFPYVELEIDFGKLPSFGGNSLSGLKIGLALGFTKKPTAPFVDAFVGFAGLSAKQLKIDFFRLLSLEIDKLAFQRYEAWRESTPNDPHTKVAALSADDVKLKILDWSPIPEGGKLQFILAERLDSPDKKSTGVLGFADLRDTKLGPLTLHWLIIGHNFAPDDKVLEYLVGDTPPASTPMNLLDKLIDETANPKRLKAQILDDNAWLFGGSFELAKILDSCRIVFYDQHFYAVSLASSVGWMKTILGVEQLSLAYLQGARKDLDRFRTGFRLAALDLLGNLKSGDLAFEWGVNWDFLADFGFPWRGSGGYDWFRAFSIAGELIETKFGFYFEKRHQLGAGGDESLRLGAGVGLYLGLFLGFGNSIVWARVGIGVFAVLEGYVEFSLGPAGSSNPLKGALAHVHVDGVIGIFAYGEAGIDIWIISARFRVQLQASCAGTLDYIPGGTSSITYAASMSAGYSASVRIGCGWFSFEFSVSGEITIGVSGRLLLH